MEQLLAPQPLKDGSLAEGWKRFKREFAQFLEATDRTEVDGKVKTAILLRVIGPRGNDIYENFDLEGTDRKDYTKVVGKFDDFCKPQEETFIARHRLLCMKQEGLSVEEFETKLRTQARYCKLGDLSDDLICHALVEGVDDKKLRDKLLMKACEQELKLPMAIKIARDFVTASAHMKELGEESQETAHRLYEKRDEKHGDKSKGTQKTKKEVKNGPCGFCGMEHRKGNCPAYGKECVYCHKKNHFERVCRQKKEDEECKAIESRPGDEYDELFVIEQQPAVSKQGKRLLTTLHHEKGSIVCQLDTASSRNVMSGKEYRSIGKPPLKPSNVTLITYNGGEMKSQGMVELKVKEMQKPIQFEVVETSLRPYPLLGCETCIGMNIVQVPDHAYAMKEKQGITTEEILEQYDEIFKGVGVMEGEYDIEINKTVKPVQHRPRRTPIMMRDDIIKKVKELEKYGILSRVEEPTEWISSQVAVRKPNGSIRLCLDPKDLNKAIVRNHYQIPTLDDILPKLAKSKCFSLLDAKDGFWHVVLSEKSRKLTTFWTPVGRYCWTRLPFGLSSSPEEYQRRLHMALDGLLGVEVIADDILIFGTGDTALEARVEHDKNLIRLLDRVKDRGIKINREKMKLHLSEVKYMGHVLTAEGIRADPDKIQGIQDLKEPETASDIKSFLGSVNYLARYIPNLSQTAAPLRASVEQKEFCFDEEARKVWNKLKEMIAEDTLLRYYDPEKPVVIECDASGRGLGAVLLQEGKPVYFASRTLSEAETRYHPIELECLAVVFACGKFDQYIYGKKDLKIMSDHRPLESIVKKDMEKSPMRLEKMLMSLQRYGFELQYKPGKDQAIADMLSRAATTRSDDRSKAEVFMNEIDDSRPEEFTDMSDKRLIRMREFGEKDEVYRALRDQIGRGWPVKRKSCDPLIQNYWTFAEELDEKDGLVYKGKRLVIPTNMVDEITRTLHSAHGSADAMMLRARDLLFWPGMWEHLKRTAEECKDCQRTKPANQKQPLQVHEFPKHRFVKVGTDVLYHQRDAYLVVVDYMSDFIELKKLDDETASTIIDACKEIFARHGVPEILQSDNAPYYNCALFKKFAEEWQFEHTTSSPGYPQSNGKAESAVKIVKHLLNTSEDPWKALMEWRASPNKDFSSPAERLYSRRIRTLVPQSQESREIQEVDLDEIKRAREMRQRRMTSDYNRGATPRSVLNHGQPVMLRQVNEKINKWRPATVLEPLSDRSYLVKNDQEQILRRNRTDLRDISMPRQEQMNEHQSQRRRGSQQTDVQQVDPEGKLPDMKRGPEQMASVKEEPAASTATRSGRISRKPARFRDPEFSSH